jgi:hypothetical protein
MDIFEFVVVSFCGLAVICWIVKTRGVASVEGYGLAFLGMAMLTDNLNLLFDYFLQPKTLLLGVNEFGFRTYPTIVHILALIVLMAGLFLGNPKPEPISREYSAAELDFAAHTGVALAILGLTLTGFAIYLTGAYSAASFFHNLDTFRGGGSDGPGPTGGFFYKGADIAVFGMALILPGAPKKARFFLILLAMLFVSFFLKANKGGLEIPILWAALVLYTYNPRRFWSLVKPRVILACLVIALAGVGVKVLLMADEAKPFTPGAIMESTIGAVGTRWGDQGVFRGYCQFINSLPQYHYLFKGYAEGVDALTSWFPRALNPNKKAQPTQGFGFMVHADAHTYKDETPAIGLVGSVYADDGFYSLTAYLLIVGFLLGLLRRYTAGRRSPLQWHISYLNFALFGGLSAEAGITNLIYTFILTFTATELAHLAIVGLYDRKLRYGSAPTQNARSPLRDAQHLG